MDQLFRYDDLDAATTLGPAVILGIRGDPDDVDWYAPSVPPFGTAMLRQVDRVVDNLDLTEVGVLWLGFSLLDIFVWSAMVEYTDSPVNGD